MVRLKRHRPAGGRFGDDSLEGVARRARRFRRHKVPHESAGIQMGYVPGFQRARVADQNDQACSAWSSLPSPIRFSRALFLRLKNARMNWATIFCSRTRSTKPEREEHCIRRLLSRRVDGLFISPVYRFAAEARIYQEILARKTPVVLLGQPAPFCKTFPGAEIEELIASYNVTQHLLKLGHKRIAYLTGPQVAPWAHERFEGYRRALARSEPGRGRQAGLPGRRHD